MRRPGILAASLVVLAAALGAPVVHAGDRSAAVLDQRPGGQVELRAGHTFRRPAPIRSPLVRDQRLTTGVTPTAATSDIQVTYNSSFSTAARQAFEAAVSVWESLIVSSQPIRVNASWTSLGTGVLGSAGPTSIVLMNDDRWYPTALAEARCACNTNGTGHDITAQFNSSFDRWYLGTDGNPSSTQYDFVTVVLHELGHGLGFLSSFDVADGVGYWGWEFDGSLYPMSFDVREWSAASGGSRMTSHISGSQTLKNQLTDGSVFFAGPNVKAVLGKRAKLYAPSPWQPGSSNSHFDEAKYPTGTEHALMTPRLANGEVIHDPGRLTLALMRDIGWTTANAGSDPTDTTAPTVSAPSVNIASPAVLGTTGLLRLEWPAASDPSGIASYELQRKKGTNAWVPVALATPKSTGADVPVTPGKNYRFRVRASDGAGNVGAWATTDAGNLGLLQETATSISYSGSWTRSSVSGASGGYVRHAEAAGRSATLTFTGTTAALVSTRAPGRGIAEIWLDGVPVDTVDLYSSSRTKMAVVWAPESPLSAGVHTLEARVTGTENAASSRPRIDVDAFLTWP